MADCSVPSIGLGVRFAPEYAAASGQRGCAGKSWLDKCLGREHFPRNNNMATNPSLTLGDSNIAYENENYPFAFTHTVCFRIRGLVLHCPKRGGSSADHVRPSDAFDAISSGGHFWHHLLPRFDGFVFRLEIDQRAVADV